MPRIHQPIDGSKIEQLCSALSKTKLADKISLLHKQHSSPLIENIKGDYKNKRITFFYYDDDGQCESISLSSAVGYLPALVERFGETILPEQAQTLTKAKSISLPALPMVKLPGTSVWTLAVDLPSESCFLYTIEVQTKDKKQLLPDPLNSQGFCYFMSDKLLWSVCDFSPSLEVQSQLILDIVREKRLIRYSISDEGLLTERSDDYNPGRDESKLQRMLTIHLPKKYTSTKTYPMRLFLDGKWYLEIADVPVILDYDNTINVMLEPKVIDGNVNIDREREYLPPTTSDLGAELFAKFLSQTFVPSIQKKFHVSTSANEVTICGSSYSGLAAIYTGLHYPEVFGNVLAQSTAFWNNKDGRLLQPVTPKEINLEQLKKSCFYLEAGLFERYHGRPANETCILLANHEFNAALNKLEIPCRLVERYSGHEFIAWKKFLPEATQALQEMCDKLNSK